MLLAATTNSVTSTTAGTALNVNRGDLLGVQATGTFSATVTIEATVDGTNYTAIALTPAAGGAAVTSFTAAGMWTANVGAYRAVRVKASAYTSGTAVVTLALGRTGG